MPNKPKPESNTDQMHLRLPAKLLAQARSCANAKGQTLPEFVRRAIRSAIDNALHGQKGGE